MTRSLMRVAVVAMCAFIPLSAQALTFKKGQVLGNDGQLYEGASPEEMDKLVAKAKDDGKTAGVFGRNLFVIVGESVSFIPLSDLSGKSQDQIEEIVVDRVTKDVMDRALQEANVAGSAATVAADGNAVVNATANAAGRQLTEEEIGLLEEMAEAASEEEVSAALASIEAADVAGVAAKEAAEATRQAWGYIDPDDLQEATQQAAEFAAQEAAKVASHMAIEDALQALQDSGASEAEIQAFMDANPAPSE